MVGIYKITSPTGKVYVGQSTNIEKRFQTYRRLQCKQQTRLYRSLQQHGHLTHIFQILETCEKCLLSTRERYWQEHFDVIGPNGLNCRLIEVDEKVAEFSKETRQLLSKVKLGIPKSEETKQRMSMFARNRPQEVRDKISANNIRNGNTPPSRKGKCWSAETRAKFKASIEARRVNKSK